MTDIYVIMVVDVDKNSFVHHTACTTLEGARRKIQERWSFAKQETNLGSNELAIEVWTDYRTQYKIFRVHVEETPEDSLDKNTSDF